MTETGSNIQKLKAIIAGAKAEINDLNKLGKNSISTIRSLLDPLNIDEDEDITVIDIEAAYLEMKQLQEFIEKMKVKKVRLNEADKELNKIKKQLEY